MNITIDKSSKTPYYLQIAFAIKDMLQRQELVHGFKMPAERKLAQELGVHRNTVIKAYSYLITEGLMTVYRTAPKGYFIDVPEEDNFVNRFFPLEQRIIYEYDQHAKLFMDIFSDTYSDRFISFAGIKMSPQTFPVERMEEIVRRLVKKDSRGNIPLIDLDETERTKKNICEILRQENMYVKPSNIELVCETSKALNCITTLYMREGDSIVVEEPVLPDIVSILQNKGLEVLTVPMEEDGMDMRALEELLKAHKPKFIYSLPNFHNPTGIVMSLEKRMKLLSIANDYGIPIIEEDSQRDFRYSDERIPSLYTLDRYKSVIYIDSFTMVFPYGIKTGYVVGPTDFVKMLGVLVSLDEITIDNIGDFLLNEYIESGLWREHTEKLAQHYKKKRDSLCRALDRIKEKGITYRKPKGGVLLWCTLDKEISERTLYEEAKKRGVLIMPGFLFYKKAPKGEGHLRLCFSNVTDEEIETGIKLLGEAMDASRGKDV
ncbi:aminotransferase-like domain-containing protein [Guggenheimella bovis]